MANVNHFIFVPVFKLELDALRELAIERVTFINRDKLVSGRRRYGFTLPISQYPGGLFQAAKTYAVLQSSRDPNNRGAITPAEWRTIYDAFWLLASSFYAFGHRKNAALSLKPVGGPFRDITIIAPASGTFHIGVFGTAPPFPNPIDKYWLQNAKHGHFYALRRILHEKTQVKASWRASLRRAAILSGQSYLARHVPEAFFCNMVAIETLVAKRTDKFPNAIIERLVALFGWLTNEDPAPWRSMVERLYKLRCGYVHDGQSGEVTDLDLLNSDILLRNLLQTLCKKPNFIKCKDDLIVLAQRSAASRILGKKPSRPGRISYHSPGNPTPEDSSTWAR